MKSKNKHLTLDERYLILDYLERDFTVTQISKLINKDRTTISKEIKKHREQTSSSQFVSSSIQCAHIRTCKKTNLCADNPNIHCRSNKQCRHCNTCKLVCADFKPDECKRLNRAPYVCNVCNDKKNCRRGLKYYYKPDLAYKEYKSALTVSREGANITEDQLSQVNDLLTPLIKDQSQPISHVYATHEDEIPFSRKTLYNYIENGLLDISNINLPRKVRYKPRKKHTKKINKTKLRENRTFDDFLKYVSEHSDDNIIEMDTVEGKKGGKVLLTLQDIKTKFQIAHLMPAKNSSNVKKVFELYRETINDDQLFRNYFAIILTDNGTEFSEIDFLERLGCKVFFCDPNRSDQKGACEKNHEYIRCYIKKGELFDEYHQNQIWRMMSHINSVKREKLNKKSPYEMMKFTWGEKLIEALRIRYIASDKVVLNKTIFKK